MLKQHYIQELEFVINICMQLIFVYSCFASLMETEIEMIL